jgi:hypothetical protein
VLRLLRASPLLGEKAFHKCEIAQYGLATASGLYILRGIKGSVRHPRGE